MNTQTFKKHLITLTIFTLLLCPLKAYPAEVIDQIVAVVNDDVITQSEVEESMAPFIADYRLRYGEEGLQEKLDDAWYSALNRLVEEKLLYQEALEKKIEVSEAEIEDRLNEAKSRFKNEGEFLKNLQEFGILPTKLRERYKEQLIVRRLILDLVYSKVSISPTQIAAYYYGHPEEFKISRRIDFKILFLKPIENRTQKQTEDLSRQLLARLKQGEDFDMLVKQYSQGPNIESGGAMGYRDINDIAPEIKDAIINLKPGDISDIIPSASGFYIARIVDIKEAGEISLAAASDEVREKIFQREAELTLREFIDKLRKNAYIKIK